MAKFLWTAQQNLGIEAIDQQHRKIVDYINQLDDAHCNGDPREEIASVISQLIDYTQTHFAFEESMLEEAKYPDINAHKEVHNQFIQRVSDYQLRFNRGEDIALELSSLLVIWLFNHIKRDDANYVKSVKAHHQEQQSGLLKKKGLFSRLFG
jgi:hemerythrin